MEQLGAQRVFRRGEGDDSNVYVRCFGVLCVFWLCVCCMCVSMRARVCVCVCVGVSMGAWLTSGWFCRLHSIEADFEHWQGEYVAYLKSLISGEVGDDVDTDR